MFSINWYKTIGFLFGSISIKLTKSFSSARAKSILILRSNKEPFSLYIFAASIILFSFILLIAYLYGERIFVSFSILSILHSLQSLLKYLACFFDIGHSLANGITFFIINKVFFSSLDNFLNDAFFSFKTEYLTMSFLSNNEPYFLSISIKLKMLSLHWIFWLL